MPDSSSIRKREEHQLKKHGEFYNTYFGAWAASTLLDHAETLPPHHPARVTINVLLDRWGYDGHTVQFTQAAEKERADRRKTACQAPDQAA